MIEIEEVKELINYSPITGKLTWRKNRRGIAKAGMECGYLHPSGYRYVRIKGRAYRSHIIAWAIQYGHWPKYQIDHINHNKQDNRIQNLRDVPQSQNMRNMPKRANNRPCFGVYWSKCHKKWRVQMHHKRKDGKRHTHVGYFTSLDEAIMARKEEEKKNRYHKNHGKNKQ